MAATNCTKEIADFYQMTQSKLARIWERDSKQCHWCGAATILTRHSIPNQATMDHVLPSSKGGSNDEGNLVLACLRCNNKRGSSVFHPAKSSGGWRINFAMPSASELINEPLHRELEIARAAYVHMRQKYEDLQSLTLWGIIQKRVLQWLINKIRRKA